MADTNIMYNKDLADKIRNDLADYFNFIALLEKERPVEIQRQIEEYIKKESSIINRIHFINEIDEGNKKTIEELAEEKTQLESKEKKEKKSKEASEAAKASLMGKSYIDYLFKTRNDIRPFASQTNVINCGMFTLRLTGETIFRYKQTLEDVLNYLFKPTNYFIERGWESLDRKSYNLMVTLMKFIRSFLHVGDVYRHNDMKVVIKQIELYIIPYLQLINPGNSYRDHLKSTFKRYLRMHKEYSENMRYTLDSLDQILSLENTGSTFFNILLGTFIVRYKQVITIAELLEHYKIKSINEEQYDFTPKIQNYIKEQLKELETKYQKSEEQLYLLRYLEEGFHFQVDTNHPLFQLYGKVYFSEYISYPKTFEDLKKMLRTDDFSFLENSEANMSSAMYIYVRGFLRIYENCLTGRISISIDGQTKQIVEIFQDWIFLGEIQTLKQQLNELEGLKGANAFLAVSFETYQHYRQTGKAELERESRLCKVFDSLLECYFTIADKMATILHNNFKGQNATGERQITLSSMQNTPLDSVIHEARLLPYASCHVRGDSHLENQTVISVLNEILIFTINFCYLYDYEPALNRLKQKQKNINQAESYHHMKAKMDG